MTLQLAGLDKRLAALRAHVDSRPVRVQVLAHRRVVAEHLVAALVRARCKIVTQTAIKPCAQKTMTITFERSDEFTIGHRCKILTLNLG